MIYVGLTDHPDERRAQHGNPPDWQQTGPFARESDARAWEKQFIGKPGYRAGSGGTGWKYGYWYTITATTREDS